MSIDSIVEKLKVILRISPKSLADYIIIVIITLMTIIPLRIRNNNNNNNNNDNVTLECVVTMRNGLIIKLSFYVLT
jgi:hypothetical protein